MNSKRALNKIREAERMINFFKEQRSRSINNNLGNLGVIEKGKVEIKKIYEKFKDGCRVDVDCYGYPNFDGGWECGQQYLNKEIILCPNCKEIKKIHDAVHAVRETGGKDDKKI